MSASLWPMTQSLHQRVPQAAYKCRCRYLWFLTVETPDPLTTQFQQKCKWGLRDNISSFVFLLGLFIVLISMNNPALEKHFYILWGIRGSTIVERLGPCSQISKFSSYSYPISCNAFYHVQHLAGRQLIFFEYMSECHIFSLLLLFPRNDSVSLKRASPQTPSPSNLLAAAHPFIMLKAVLFQLLIPPFISPCLLFYVCEVRLGMGDR